MTQAFSFLAMILLINLSVGMLRVLRGPTAADRMLAAQLFGTTGVAITLLLAQVSQQPGLRDVALVFAILAAVVAVAFVKRTVKVPA